MKPFRKQGIFVWDDGRETLLYCAEEKVFHLINSTAKLIWELCDGEHTLEDMEQAICSSFSVRDTHDVIGDIQRTIELFACKGILEKIILSRRCKCIGPERCFH